MLSAVDCLSAVILNDCLKYLVIAYEFSAALF